MVEFENLSMIVPLNKITEPLHRIMQRLYLYLKRKVFIVY